MDLKSGCIYWPQVYRGTIPRCSRLGRDVRCDVAVIGSGISGALVAYHLVREGVHVVMLDRREVGTGSTAASSGLLLYEIDTPLVELIGKLGREKAEAAYQGSLAAVRNFEPLVEELGDRCGLVARKSLYLAAEERHVEGLRAECEARRAMGIDVRYLSRKALAEEFGIARPAALVSREAFEVDPYRLTLRLITRSMEMGLEMYSPERVVGWEMGEGGVILRLASGACVKTKKVVIATGYETMEFLPSDLCQLASTFVVVSRPGTDLSSWRERCLIWESARPYLYLRTTEDGRVMVGGADVDVVDEQERDGMLEEKAEVLCERFSELMPSIEMKAECAWTGTFGWTEDGLPYIGNARKWPDMYFALGYGGNGITFSLMAAKIIADSFAGRVNPYAGVFGFER